MQIQIEKKEENKFTQLRKIVELSNEFEGMETKVSGNKLSLTTTPLSCNPCSDFDQIVYDSHAIMAGFIVVNNLPINPEEVMVEYGITYEDNNVFEEVNLTLPLREAMDCIKRNW